MDAGFEPIFAKLKQAFAAPRKQLCVSVDTATEYTLVGTIPSPMKQHKGHPIYFGSVRLGKAYVAFHLMPQYMDEELTATISQALKKRMQGKTCFNFKAEPEPEILAELKRLTDAGYKSFRTKKWL